MSAFHVKQNKLFTYNNIMAGKYTINYTLNYFFYILNYIYVPYFDTIKLNQYNLFKNALIIIIYYQVALKFDRIIFIYCGYNCK